MRGLVWSEALICCSVFGFAHGFYQADMQAQHEHDQTQLREARNQIQDLRMLLQQTLQAAAYRGVPRSARDRNVSAANTGHMPATSSSLPPPRSGLLAGATAVSELRQRLSSLGQVCRCVSKRSVSLSLSLSLCVCVCLKVACVL